MGLQATGISNPLDRFLPPANPNLKRKSSTEIIEMVDAPKKICIEVLKEDAEDCRNVGSDDMILPTCNSESSDSEEDNDKENQGNFDSILAKTLLAAAATPAATPATPASKEEGPKVIVQHSPLPSIYELQQITTSCDNLDDSGLSTDSDESDEEVELRLKSTTPPMDVTSEGDSQTPSPSPPTPAPQKVLYQDRFWNQTPPPTPPPSMQQQQQNNSNNFQFLDQTNQRIECAENGKSYLQLGTMSHHNLPVTPIIQPKTNMVYRRPIPPFRNNIVRPVCDHSNCLQKKSSFCYKNQRSRMLNISLHKLHLARQNHEGSLRRSVLICNMLRNIEDETEKEAVVENQQYQQAAQAAAQAAAAAAAAAAANEQQQYSSWNGDANYNQQQMQSSQVVPPGIPGQTSPPYDSSYENTLKDFNSAFRSSTPYSMDTDSDHSSINWSSVLSLSSQSELDPLNNNSFNNSGGDSWTTNPNTNTTTTDTSNLDSHSFEDIGWKLSADDVLKAFPNDEHIFVGP